MAWNGSGAFVRVHNWVADLAAGNPTNKITASRMDAEFDNYKTGLENCLTRDGQNSPSANLPMGPYRHTGVNNATARTNYPAAGQVQDGAMVYAADSGSADAYAITLSPAITAYAAGQGFRFKAGNANTGASTINVNAVGAKSIKKDGSSDLAAGDIVSGGIYDVVYDGTNFQLQNPAAVTPTSLATIQAGAYAYAVDTGSADAYAISLTPNLASYAAGMTFRFKADNTNTGASTLDIDSVGATAIRKNGTTALDAGDIVDGVVYTVAYDGTYFQLLNPTHADLEVTIQSGAPLYAADSGAADAYVMTLSPALTAYAAGQTFRFKAANANTGTSTVNINALGIKTIKKNVSEDLDAGDIIAGDIIEITYDGTNFLMSPAVRKGFTTTVVSGSPTSISFTGIPSWARKLRLVFYSVSYTGGGVEARIGPTGGVEATGYTSGAAKFRYNSGPEIFSNTSTTGFLIGGANDTLSGTVTIATPEAGGNYWVFDATGQASGTNFVFASGGAKQITGPLSRLTLTAASITFTGGRISLEWES